MRFFIKVKICHNRESIILTINVIALYVLLRIKENVDGLLIH